MNEPDDEILRRFQEKYDEARDALDGGALDRRVPDSDLPDSDLPSGDLPSGDLPDSDLPDSDLPDRRSSRNPPPMRRLAEHLSDMQGALRKISSGAVSRQTLTQVVRECVEEILEDKKAAVFPAVDRLARAVESWTAESEKSVHALRDEMRVSLGTFRGDMGKLRSDMGKLRSDMGKKSESLRRAVLDAVLLELGRVTDELRSLPAKLGARQEFQEIRARLTGLQKQLDRKRDNPPSGEEAASVPAGDRADPVGTRLDALESRLARIEGSIDSLRAGRSSDDPGTSIDRLESSVSRLLLLEVLDRFKSRRPE
jgi:chromosome segregation ATPase